MEKIRVSTARFWLIAAVAIVLGVSSFAASNTRALALAWPDTAFVCPDSTWRTEGDVFSLGLCISAVPGVMGYNFSVTFDSSVIEILSAAEGPLPQSLPNTFFWWYDAGVKSNVVRVNGAVLGGTMNGPGEVITLTFLAKAHGVVRTTDVVVAQSELRDGDNLPIGHETNNGFVQVEPPATGIETQPIESGFLRCYPNPFNPSVTIVVAPPGATARNAGSCVTLGLYTADGRIVRTLFDGRMNSGGGRFVWDGTDGGGNDVASGVYFAVAETGGGTFRSKIVLVR
jgi:hypothetical protein